MEQIKLKKSLKNLLIKKIIRRSPTFILSRKVSLEFDNLYIRKLRLSKPTFLNALGFHDENPLKYPLELLLYNNNSKSNNISTYSLKSIFIIKNLNLIFIQSSILFYNDNFLNPKLIFNEFKSTLLLSLKLIFLIKEELK